MPPYYYRVIPTQTVPSTGLLIDIGYPLDYGYVTIIESAGVAYTLQFGVSDVGLVGIPLPVPASQPYEVKSPGIKGLRQVHITGAGAQITGVIASYDVPPDAIVIEGPITATISGTVKTDVGQGSQVAGNTTLNYNGSAIDPRAIRSLGSSDQPDVSVNQTNPFKVAPLATNKNSGNLIPTAVAESTVETIKVTGAGVIPLGSRVYYSIACSAVVEVAAATEVIQYVAIKGHTSGNYYVIAYAGQSSQGTFDFTLTPETLDIVVKNSSAATGCNVTAFWSAAAP